MSEDENAYWQQRAEMEREEHEYRQRRRKTLPWNIVAGVALAAVVLYFVVSIATNL